MESKAHITISFVSTHFVLHATSIISDSSKLIYLFGGYNGHFWLNDLWVYSIETSMWTCIQESSDPPTLNGAAALADEAPRLVGAAIGGGLSNGVQGLPPSRRFGHVSVVHEGNIRKAQV
jgi:hypothetical protein